MKVSELAEELGVPASAVLDQCQRFGIDAGWAGAELRRADQVVLRAELALEGGPGSSVDGADVAPTPSDRPDPAKGREPDRADQTDAADGPSTAALPPTAAASMPELFDASADATSATSAERAGGFSFAGARHGDDESGAAPAASSGTEPSKRAVSPHFDSGLRTVLIAFGLSALLVVGSNVLLHNPWPIAVAWVAAAIILVFGTVRAAQVRYRASTHPERIRGTVIATALTGIGLVAVVFAGLMVWTIARTEPSEGAPLKLGRPAAVQQLRWGLARLRLTVGNGWDPAAKDPGTCWEVKGESNGDTAKPRRDDREELGNNLTSCFGPHIYEVIDRWSVNRDRDSTYPGVPGFQALVVKRCTEQIDRLNDGGGDQPPAGATLAFEYPSADAWKRGDHDLTCVAQTQPRSGRLSE